MALGVGIAVHPARAPAQIIRLQAGTSSLHEAQGGAISIWEGSTEGWLGVGDLNPLRMGAGVRTRYRGTDVSLGDQVVPFQLPTDVFGTGQSFLGRGVGARYIEGNSSLFALGGTTATGFATPYGFGARSEQPVGLIFLENQVSSSIRVSSRTLYSGLMTEIMGIDWMAGRNIQAALAAGAGAQEGYFAASARGASGPLAVRAAYILSGDGFRRVVTPQPQASELDRENVEVSLRPSADFAVVAARNRYMQPMSPGSMVSGRTGSVNQFSVSGRAVETSANVAFFLSETPGAGATGVTFSLGRDAGRLLKLQGSVLHSNPRRGESSTTFVGSVREVLSPRLELLQLMTHSAGNTTVSFGGNLLLDRLNVSAEYQTIYVPFAAEDNFRQALMLNVRLQTFGDFQANLGSYVGPDGEVRYTIYGSQFLYHGKQPGSRQDFHIGSYLVRGRVLTDTGEPVEGAAIRIGDEVVYTDTQGTFFIRMNKERKVQLEVRLAEFSNPAQFSVISAPVSVQASSDDQAPEVRIVLHRLVLR